MKDEKTTIEITPDDFPTLAEFEQKIHEEVEKQREAQKAELKKNGKVNLHFTIEGTGMTRIMRDSWASDTPYHAAQQLGCESLGCSLEQAIQVCTGKKMFVGDSTVGSLFLVDDDGRLNEEFKSCNWTLNDMITRCETRFLNDSNDRASFIRILNGLKINDTIEDDEDIMVEDIEWMTPNELREKCNYLEVRIKKKIDELELLYPLVGKTLKDLPTNLIGTERNPMENHDFIGKKEFERKDRLSKAYKKNLQEVTKMTAQQRQEKEDEEDRRQDERFKNEIRSNMKLLVPRSSDNMSDVSSGYILPDGRMIGGPGYAMIHDHITFWLKEAFRFEEFSLLRDIKYINEITEKTAEEEGWIKLSAGHGFMLYQHSAREVGKIVTVTEQQKETITDWCIANEEEKIEFNGQWMPLQEFTNMSGDDIMEYRKFRWRKDQDED